MGGMGLKSFVIKVFLKELDYIFNLKHKVLSNNIDAFHFYALNSKPLRHSRRFHLID